MNTAEVHAIEHLAQRICEPPGLAKRCYISGPWAAADRILLLLGGEYEPADITGLLNGMCRYMIALDGEIPARAPGNAEIIWT
jgi:hypothetical protein